MFIVDPPAKDPELWLVTIHTNQPHSLCVMFAIFSAFILTFSLVFMQNSDYILCLFLTIYLFFYFFYPRPRLNHCITRWFRWSRTLRPLWEQLVIYWKRRSSSCQQLVLLYRYNIRTPSFLLLILLVQDDRILWVVPRR